MPFLGTSLLLRQHKHDAGSCLLHVVACPIALTITTHASMSSGLEWGHEGARLRTLGEARGAQCTGRQFPHPRRSPDERATKIRENDNKKWI